MNTVYPLLPVAVLTLMAYVITRLFAEWKIIMLRTHRKIWNVLLLVTFFVCGLSGLLSIVKVNYKLNIPHDDALLRWHVVAGAVMVFVAFFHLSWHLKYYFTRSKGKTALPGTACHPEHAAGSAPLLFLLGVVAMISQMVLIREFISVLAGNELIVGVVMAGWMLLTGWGARHAGKRVYPGFNLNRGIIMLAGLPFLSAVMVALPYWLKSQLFPPGTLIGLGTTITGVFLLLFPVTFLSGYLFTVFSSALSWSANKNLTGKAYSRESLGSLAGGLVFSLILGRFLSSIQILGLTTGVVFLAGIWLNGNGKARLAWLLIPGILIFIFGFNPDLRIRKLLYPNQEIILEKSTSYGNLLVTRQAGQLNFYENNDLQFYTDNRMLSEEAVHFAMLQHEHPREVLLISGGLSGMIQEIRKYDVKKITYLEANPEIFRHWKHLSGFTEQPGQVELVKKDIRTFLNQTGNRYDVILINLPPPSTLGFNRFYTEEFFRSVKQHGDGQSVVCTSLPSTVNYAEENASEVNASLWKTLGVHYRHRLLLPGEKNYFLASDGVLSAKIAQRADEKGIVNDYVNRFYLDDELLARRGQGLVAGLGTDTPLNRDFYPFMFIKQIGYWLHLFGAGYYFFAGVPAVFFLLWFFRLNAVTAGLYTGGFTSASLEVTLLLAFQVFFGSIYLTTAFFFSVFMGGLALGSSRGGKRRERYSRSYYAALQFLLALFALVLPSFILLTGRIVERDFLSRFLFFLLIFILAFVAGHEFHVASTLRPLSYREISGVNYSTDLTGAALGSFLAPIVLLPVLGLVYTCVFVAGLNIFSGLLALRIRQ